MEFRMREKPEWGRLATPAPNRRLPVYNWFCCREGFSRELVFRLLDMFSPGKGLVLDPFCGAGTTMLACRERGFASLGFDVHPLFVFASGTKLADYDLPSLRQEVRRLLDTPFRRPEARSPSPLARRAFRRETLEDVLFFRDAVTETPDRKARGFLLLGLMNAAMGCSYAWKDGAVIRFRRRPVPPLRKRLSGVLKGMLKGYEALSRASPGAEAVAGLGDARRLPLEGGSVDFIITSPPYLNKTEYARAYRIEQELFLGFAQEIRHPGSFVGLAPDKGRGGLPGPAVAAPYMADMRQAIREMHRVCRPGGRVGLVIGNGCFPGGVVESDVLLSRMAVRAGFRVRGILVLNRRWCTKRRVQKVGITRESLLLWEK